MVEYDLNPRGYHEFTISVPVGQDINLFKKVSERMGWVFLDNEEVRKVPFNLDDYEPNATTRRAMEDARLGRNLHYAASVEDLFKQILG